MKLYRIPSGWAEPAPARCPNGHRLGPNRTLVGSQVCDCGVMHRTHACRVCDAVVYSPPLGDRCRARAFDER
ncbi:MULTISPECIES: hypothetical protein [unclassified Rhodococcus (in: high G+C Gram-positive bacteria)]|uniref:hypothetical protein n=1 Tax=unclassified Rhodococcus (in: high G+C Gram-positive bacteria) TaxID=192944 RepID=UPI00146BFD94|nr:MULTISPECIES: hypothetical protein [unclassified Rhodococcus (in: high G+C Gram-positive bacteria)]NMD93815.1 hypothetical protein [Rhodococcus sp. BL-253-APC-6A1W]NME77942.1 hypothetical protein [Rhodococcus sp. 105337]